MNAQVYHMNSIDLTKNLKELNDPEVMKVAYTVALNHLMRGAMEGANNKPYIDATQYCYDMLVEMIQQL